MAFGLNRSPQARTLEHLIASIALFILTVGWAIYTKSWKILPVSLIFLVAILYNLYKYKNLPTRTAGQAIQDSIISSVKK